MWPIVLAFGTVALFLALAKGSARAAKPGAPQLVTPSPVPPALPSASSELVTVKPEAPKAPKCSKADTDFVANVLRAMQKGTATVELMLKARAIASRCLPATAVQIDKKLKEAAAAARAKQIPDAQQQLAALLKAPDAPASPIPIDPKTGKSLWFMDTRGGLVMAIPRFGPVLNLFKKLQSLVGAKQDGRVGPGTVKAFTTKMKSRGFTKFPDSQAKLAANVTKYITIINAGLKPAQVGARGGSAVSAPFPGC